MWLGNVVPPVHISLMLYSHLVYCFTIPIILSVNNLKVHFLVLIDFGTFS